MIAFTIEYIEMVATYLRWFVEQHRLVATHLSRRKVRQHIRVSFAGFLIVTAFSAANYHVVDEAVRWSFILIMLDTFWKEDGGIDL